MGRVSQKHRKENQFPWTLSSQNGQNNNNITNNGDTKQQTTQREKKREYDTEKDDGFVFDTKPAEYNVNYNDIILLET